MKLIKEIRSELVDAEINLSTIEAIRDIPREKVNNVFNLTVHGDHNVLASGTDFSQTVHQNIASQDQNALFTYLLSKGVSEDDLEELEKAIAEDGPRPDKKYGKRVLAWIGKMTSKAVQGAWEVTLDTAPKLLTNALSSYYGWD